MAKMPLRLAMLLVAACFACSAAPALAQANRGAVAPPAPHVSVPAPAPHISVPTPHISAPAVPHVSAPVPRITVLPHSAAPHVGPTPRVAMPRVSPRTPTGHQFTPRGHGVGPRGFERQPVQGPTASRHARGRAAGRSPRSASRNMPGRDLPRRATRAAGNPDRSTPRGHADNRNRDAERNNRPSAAARTEHKRVSPAQLAALSRPLGERNRNDNERRRWFHERRRFHRGGFVGWFGPVFWPYAYDDFFDYAFWPYEYDNYGFWAYAYDDIFDNVFFTPGTEDVYASVGGGYAGRGRHAGRRRGHQVPRGPAELCRVDPGLTRWPIDEIVRVVEPTGEQRSLLDNLKAASARAAQLLHTACPAKAPSTPLGRIDAMAKRLDTMVQALDVVRPALAKLYDSLSDEQKARFNAMGRQQTAGGNGAAGDEARLCRTQAPAGLTDEAMNRIEQEVRPDDRQKADLDGLRDAAAKAADILHNACPSQTPITPVARLDAMATHVKAMLDAINAVRPALARFYDSLSDEQKAHFNIMAQNQ
jgi:LTXXQ motif family protein